MKRREALGHALALGLLGMYPGAGWAQDAGKIGVLMLHGKNPGGPSDPNFSTLKGRFESLGWQVALPDMPWSRNRYLDGHWDQAMQEVATHVKQLQDKGAQKIVLAGHSMGCPAALSHAARGGTAHALVLLAPGHIPYGYYNYPTLKTVRESIDDARAKVAAGQGDEKHRFNDINQGRQQPVVTSAKNFLSYFDPASDADMGVTAPRIPADLPVFTAIGEKDPLFRNVRGYYVDKLPANPKSRYLEVPGGHLDTPREAGDQLVAWLREVLA